MPAGPPAGQAGSVRRAAGQHDRARARERGGRVQKERDGSRASRSWGSFGTKIHTWRIAGAVPWTDAPRPGLIADRAYDRDDFRAWLAQRGIEAVIPARRGRLNPHPTTRNARNDTRCATAWGIGGLKPWRRVATRYDKHAQRFLGFLYWAAACLWLKS